MQTSRQTGFSLIEAIVALALIGIVGIALFSWINASLTSLVRVEESLKSQAASRIALEFIGTVNPMLNPSGVEEIGDYSVEWEATPVEGPVGGNGYPNRIPSYYQVGLYETDVSTSRLGKTLSNFSIRQVGYRRVRGFGVAQTE